MWSSYFTPALKAAFEKTKRLHRDVTPGNIILYNDPERGLDLTTIAGQSNPRKGYLIDWELSRECEPKGSKSYVGDESCAVSVSVFRLWL